VQFAISCLLLSNSPGCLSDARRAAGRQKQIAKSDLKDIPFNMAIFQYSLLPIISQYYFIPVIKLDIWGEFL
jgi:hypothetical protein